MNKLAALTLLASSLILASCASAPPQQSGALLQPGTGVVVASFQFSLSGTNENAHEHRIELPHMEANIKPVDAPGGDTAVLSTSHAWRVPAVTLATEKGDRVMSMASLKPGRYKIRRLEASFIFFKKQNSVLPSQDILFDVKEGQVTYIGSIQAVATMGRDNQGQVTPTAIALSVRDEFAADVAAMKKADPSMGALVLRDGLRP